MQMLAHAKGAESTEEQGGHCVQAQIERGSEFIMGCFSTKQIIYDLWIYMWHILHSWGTVIR